MTTLKTKSKRTPEQWFSLIATTFSFLLIMMGVASLFAIQLKLYQPQETRSDASVSNGLVTISSVTSVDNSTNKVTITLRANTNSVSTTGLQLYATVLSDTFSQAELSFLGSSGLSPMVYELTNITGGVSAKILAIPQAGPTGTFTTSQDVPFATISFTPTKNGTVVLSFDQNNSHAYVYKTEPPRDELATIASNSFAVVVNASPTPTPTATPTTISTKKYCDQECTNTSECESGLECRNNRCRLASNPDDTTCSLKGNTTTVTEQQTVTQYEYITQQQIVTTTNNTQPSSTKGDSVTTDKMKSATQSAATASATLTSPTPLPTYQPLPVASPMPNTPASDQSAFAAVMTNLLQRGQNLPLAMIISGVIIIILVLAFIMIKKGGKPTPPAKNTQPSSPSSPQDQAYLKNLEQRIGALKTEQQVTPTQPLTQQPLPTTPRPITNTQPRALAPQPTLATTSASPKPATAATPTPQLSQYLPSQPPLPAAPAKTQVSAYPSTNQPRSFTPPPVRQTQPVTPAKSAPQTSGMVDKLKQKGITVPGQTVFDQQQPPATKN